jgi:hypothetical protein
VPASTTTGRPAPGERDVPARLSAPAANRSIATTLARNLDALVVILAAAPAIALGAPALGYAIGAGAWLAQSLLAHYDGRLITRRREPGSQAGLLLFEAYGRIWLLAGAIVVAGVAGGRADGLTAAVTIFVAYSIAFGLRVIAGRPGAMVDR